MRRLLATAWVVVLASLVLRIAWIEYRLRANPRELAAVDRRPQPASPEELRRLAWETFEAEGQLVLETPGGTELVVHRLKKSHTQLLPHLRPLVGLQVSGLGYWNADLLKEIAACTELKSLSLSGSQLTSRPHLLDRGPRPLHLGALKALQGLESLDLSHAKAFDDHVQSLVGLKKLRTLILTEGQITDTVLDPLLQFPALESLVLRKCRITDAAIPKLLRLPALRRVDLRETLLTPAGFNAFRQAFSGIAEFTVPAADSIPAANSEPQAGSAGNP